MYFRHILPVLLLSSIASARTLEVGAGVAYATLEAAAAATPPGDTILFRGGVHAGGQYVEGLQGRPDAWITITVAEGEEAIIRGGSNGWQLSDPAYVRITGFVLEGQTGNGLNIDDAGSLETPAHHIVIRLCEWRGIDAEGNNDLLKLSGIDSFEVSDCAFQDGSPGGSMIDMVGCHDGRFIANRFQRGGSNCIQAKGGTRNIRIERNLFINGGARALNIGGSTGLAFFRPQGINYESADIRVYSNIFIGSDAPIAFVGTVNSEVVNNTIWLPRRWAIRILQETTEQGFLQCGDNVFHNNIVVVDNAAANPTVNIGPNTRPESFTFSNNLWYNTASASWNGPNLPVAETNGLIGRDPMLTNPPDHFTLRPGSPAIGAGYGVNEPTRDFFRRAFVTPRSVGAVEGGTSTTSVSRNDESPIAATVTVSPSGNRVTVGFTMARAGTVEVELYDSQGRTRRRIEEHRAAGNGTIVLPIGDLPSGFYLCLLRCATETIPHPIIVQR